MSSRVEVHDLRKSFGTIVAVDGISFTVDSGEILGFLGPNGAGKSTTMRILTGYLPPDSGSVSICGIDILHRPVPAKARIGYLPEGAPLYPEMTPASFLGFVADIRGITGNGKAQRLARVAEIMHLKEVWHQPIETLSKGFKRRVGLAQAIVHDPDVLILDEPTDGLDPNQKREVRQLVRDMARDKAIIISTHILEEVHAVCTRAAIISRGRIVADGTPGELEAMSEYNHAVTIQVRADDAVSLSGAIARLPDVRKVDTLPLADRLVEITAFPAGGERIITGISRMLQEGSWDIVEVRHESGRLDEVFLSLTAGGAEEAQGGAR
ncbi:MAG: ATP-binding cassette domain-containing protein [bacterium]|nr:MAG: ATP-binding cassette domain-containing protein [bacterium]